MSDVSASDPKPFFLLNNRPKKPVVRPAEALCQEALDKFPDRVTFREEETTALWYHVGTCELCKAAGSKYWRR